MLNTGFWGIPVKAGATYFLTLYLRAPEESAPASKEQVAPTDSFDAIYQAVNPRTADWGNQIMECSRP